MKNRIVIITIIIYPRNNIFMMSEWLSERALIPSMNGSGQPVSQSASSVYINDGIILISSSLKL